MGDRAGVLARLCPKPGRDLIASLIIAVQILPQLRLVPTEQFLFPTHPPTHRTNHWKTAVQLAGKDTQDILNRMDAEKLGEHILDGTLSNVCQQQLAQEKGLQERQKASEVSKEMQTDVTKSADTAATLS